MTLKCNEDCQNCIYPDCVWDGGNRERVQRHYYKHRDKILAERRERYALLKHNKDYIEKNRAYHREYRKNNPEKIKEHRNKHKDKRKGLNNVKQ